MSGVNTTPSTTANDETVTSSTDSANSLPTADSGVMSPYPTVLPVTSEK